MSATEYVTPGSTCSLGTGNLLVRLTGRTDGVRIRSADGLTVGESRVVRELPATDAVLEVHPSGTTFSTGTRIGVELTTVGGTGRDQLVCLDDLDVGDLTHYPMVRVNGNALTGWQVNLATDERPTDFDFLRPAGADPKSQLDERALPWIVGGRTLLRRARLGDPDQLPDGVTWAVLVDVSTSSAASAPGDVWGAVLDRVCGIMAERTGNEPEHVELLTEPAVRLGARPDRSPGTRLVDALSECHRPDWTRITPQVKWLAERGVQEVVCLVDGPPADITDVRALTGIDVRFVLLTSGAWDENGNELLVGLFNEFSRSVAVVDVQAGPTSPSWVRVASGLDGGAR